MEHGRRSFLDASPGPHGTRRVGSDHPEPWLACGAVLRCRVDTQPVPLSKEVTGSSPGVCTRRSSSADSAEGVLLRGHGSRLVPQLARLSRHTARVRPPVQGELTTARPHSDPTPSQRPVRHQVSNGKKRICLVLGVFIFS